MPTTHTRTITLKALLQLLVAQLLQAAVSNALEMCLARGARRRIGTSLGHLQVAAVAKEVAFRALEDVTCIIHTQQHTLTVSFMHTYSRIQAQGCCTGQ